MKQTRPKGVPKRIIARKAAFLRAFSSTGSVTASARLAGIDRTTHYEWLSRDAKYKAGFEMATDMANDAALDELVRRGTIGDFKPLIYKGEFQYANRERRLCTLQDGTTAFEDELPKGARVVERRRVTTRGEMLGVYKKNARALCAALVALRRKMKGTAKRRKGTPSTGFRTGS
jgi:hypothetical protein